MDRAGGYTVDFDGISIKIDPATDRGVEACLYFYGQYEWGTIKVIKSLLQPGDKFADVGANIGLMTLFAARAVGPSGEVFSFEPNPPVHAILRENVSLNGFTNVHFFQSGVGAEKSQLKLYSNAANNRGANSFMPTDKMDAAKFVTVGVDRLPALLRDWDYERIKLIKIDVEGWEPEVLKGAREWFASERAPMIVTEYSRGRTHGKVDLFDYITQVNDYRVFILVKGKEVPSPLRLIKHKSELPEHENLFCFLPQHLEQLPDHLFDR